MSTRLHLKCDGCDAETYTERIKKTFVSLSGRSYGLGSYRAPNIDDAVLPSRWVWSDPYTSCTYCPTCWDKIEAGERTAEVRQTMNQS